MKCFFCKRSVTSLYFADSESESLLSVGSILEALKRELFILRSAAPHVYDYLIVWTGTCFGEHVLPSYRSRRVIVVPEFQPRMHPRQSPLDNQLLRHDLGLIGAQGLRLECRRDTLHAQMGLVRYYCKFEAA